MRVDMLLLGQIASVSCSAAAARYARECGDKFLARQILSGKFKPDTAFNGKTAPYRPRAITWLKDRKILPPMKKREAIAA